DPVVDIARELEDARTEHQEILEQIETTRLKLQNDTQTLQELEVRIANLGTNSATAQEYVGEQARETWLIFNAAAGSLRPSPSLDRVIECLDAHNVRVRVESTASEAEARAVTRRAVQG